MNTSPVAASRLPARMADDALADEIELYGELVVAASEADGPLDQPVIDRLLGVDPS